MNNSDIMPAGHVDDLAEMDGGDGVAQKDQRIEELEDELRLARKNNEMLIAAKSSDTKDLFQKISDLESSLLEKDFENKALKEKQESSQKRLEKIKTEYDNLSAQFTDNTKSDALKLQTLKNAQNSRVNSVSE